MKVFASAFGTETNTFSPIPTGMQSFRDGLWAEPGELPDELTEVTAPNWLARRRRESHGWQVVEGLCAFAYPAGLTTRRAYEAIRDTILKQAEASLPLDAVIVSMHGAMVADGYDDCEGDFLSRLRSVVGTDVFIGVELDLHCNLSQTMVDAADVIITFKEYPHTDFLERADELLSIAERCVSGLVEPQMSVFDCRMAGLYFTTTEPMAGFVRRVQELEGQDGILSVSVAHGFPWADVKDLSAKILVVNDKKKRRESDLAEILGREFIAMRDETLPIYTALVEALNMADGSGPVVLADTADNAGGGAGSDSTYVLAEMLQRNVQDACLGPMFDPVSVRHCIEAGAGARFNLRLGGKIGPCSGNPLDVEVEVTRVIKNGHQSFAGTSSAIGDAAAIRVGGIDVVITSLRVQALGLDLFTGLGIDPAKKRVVVVKSAQHFHEAYSQITERIVYLATPGTLERDLTKLSYNKIQRPLWPFDPHPYSE